MKNYKTLPKWLKEKYLEAVNHKCQQCQSKLNLQIHRIKRGINGGFYSVYKLNSKKNNIKVLCKKCHRKYHIHDSPKVGYR